jgi:hypothetical protein
MDEFEFEITTVNTVFRIDLVHFSIKSVGDMRLVIYPTDTVLESAVWRVPCIVV